MSVNSRALDFPIFVSPAKKPVLPKINHIILIVKEVSLTLGLLLHSAP